MKRKELNLNAAWIDVIKSVPKNNTYVIAYDEDSLTPEKKLLYRDGKFLYCKYGQELDYTNSIRRWRHLDSVPVHRK